MFWTNEARNSVGRSGMDGSNPLSIISGLNGPRGIKVDFEESRIYFTVASDHKIESSNFQGGDRRTVIQVSSDSYPYGIVLLNNKIYWANLYSKTIQCCTKDGGDTEILLNTGTSGVGYLTAVPMLNLPRNRINHCAQQSCSKVCVLTTTSSRCLN